LAPATVTDREVPNENVEATDYDNVEEIDAIQTEYPEHRTPENSQSADGPYQDENEDEEQLDTNVMITQTVEASALDNLRIVENVSIEVDPQILNNLNQLVKKIFYLLNQKTLCPSLRQLETPMLEKGRTKSPKF
jgi:hypothetical protein